MPYLGELPSTIASPRGDSVMGASTSLLRDLLDTFEDELRRQGVPVNEYLRSGLPADALLETFAASDIDAPRELIVWFGWHNGPTRVEGSHQVFPLFWFWSIEETIKLNPPNPTGYLVGEKNLEWNPNWLKIMGQGNGLAVSVEDALGEPPLVRSVTYDLAHGTQADDTAHQVVSLCTPVTWWIESLREGWYRWLPSEKAWDIDFNKQPAERYARGLS
jgi:hypothetical protein